MGKGRDTGGGLRVPPGPPLFDREGITLHHGRAENVLPHLGGSEPRFDALLTDPPFGIGFDYGGKHDDRQGPEEYGCWLWGVVEAAERLLKPGSLCFIWQAMPNIRHFADWFPRDFRLFACCKNFVQLYPGTAMSHAWDPAVLWWTEGKRWVPKRNRVSRDWHVANTAAEVAKVWNLAKEHPCPRPLDQVEYLVRQFVRPGGLVLDPFLGSGTTAVACYRAGRKCVGVEQDPDFCDLARKRVEDERGCGTLGEIRKVLYRRKKGEA